MYNPIFLFNQIQYFDSLLIIACDFNYLINTILEIF
jgi:hypothetical protein